MNGADNIVRSPNPEMQNGAGIAAGPVSYSLRPGPGPLHPCGVRIHGQALVHVIARFGVVGAPTVGPDTSWSCHALTGAENDADRLVVENERKTRHAHTIGKPRTITFVLQLIDNQ